MNGASFPSTILPSRAGVELRVKRPASPSISLTFSFMCSSSLRDTSFCKASMAEKYSFLRSSHSVIRRERAFRMSSETGSASLLLPSLLYSALLPSACPRMVAEGPSHSVFLSMAFVLSRKLKTFLPLEIMPKSSISAITSSAAFSMSS